MVAVALLKEDTLEQQEGDTLEQQEGDIREREQDMVVALEVYTLLVGEGSLQRWVGLVAALVADTLKETSMLLMFFYYCLNTAYVCVCVCVFMFVLVCECACVCVFTNITLGLSLLWGICISLSLRLTWRLLCSSATGIRISGGWWLLFRRWHTTRWI